MKKLIFSGVNISLFLFVVLFFMACSKGGSSGGGTGPIVPPPPAPVLTLPTMPTTPLWNGDNYSGSYSVRNVPNGAVLKLNGNTVPTPTGPVNLTNLTSPEVLNFVLTKSATDASILTSSSATVPVAGTVLTTLGKTPIYWKNTLSMDSSENSGGGWISYPPKCEYWKFNSDNTCTLVLTHCGLPGNTSSYNVVNTAQNTLTIGGTNFVIQSLTATTLVTRINGPTVTTVQTWQAQF